MNILVINAGSSSLKYQLLNPETQQVLAKGLCERIGIDGKSTYKLSTLPCPPTLRPSRLCWTPWWTRTTA